MTPMTTNLSFIVSRYRHMLDKDKADKELKNLPPFLGKLEHLYFFIPVQSEY